MQDHKKGYIGIALLFIFVSGTGLLLTIFILNKTANNKENTLKSLYIYKDPNSTFNKMPPAEHLVQAKKDMADKSTNWPYGRLSLAKKHLDAIPVDSDEYNEAQQLLKETAKRRKLDIEYAKKLNIKIETDNRKDYAKRSEVNYLEAGMDVEVSTSGKNQTTIKSKNILFSRPFIYKLNKDGALLSKYKSLGFEKAIFSNGYETYTYDLTK